MPDADIDADSTAAANPRQPSGGTEPTTALMLSMLQTLSSQVAGLSHELHELKHAAKHAPGGLLHGAALAGGHGRSHHTSVLDQLGEVETPTSSSDPSFKQQQQAAAEAAAAGSPPYSASSRACGGGPCSVVDRPTGGSGGGGGSPTERDGAAAGASTATAVCDGAAAGASTARDATAVCDESGGGPSSSRARNRRRSAEDLTRPGIGLNDVTRARHPPRCCTRCLAPDAASRQTLPRARRTQAEGTLPHARRTQAEGTLPRARHTLAVHHAACCASSLRMRARCELAEGG